MPTYEILVGVTSSYRIRVDADDISTAKSIGYAKYSEGELKESAVSVIDANIITMSMGAGIIKADVSQDNFLPDDLAEMADDYYGSIYDSQ